MSKGGSNLKRYISASEHNTVVYDINEEDADLVREHSSNGYLDLDNAVSVRYFNNVEEEAAHEIDFEGGYVVKYADGSERYFGWRPYEVDSVTELTPHHALRFSEK